MPFLLPKIAYVWHLSSKLELSHKRWDYHVGYTRLLSVGVEFDQNGSVVFVVSKQMSIKNLEGKWLLHPFFIFFMFSKFASTKALSFLFIPQKETEAAARINKVYFPDCSARRSIWLAKTDGERQKFLLVCSFIPVFGCVCFRFHFK